MNKLYFIAIALVLFALIPQSFSGCVICEASQSESPACRELCVLGDGYYSDLLELRFFCYTGYYSAVFHTIDSDPSSCGELAGEAVSVELLRSPNENPFPGYIDFECRADQYCEVQGASKDQVAQKEVENFKKKFNVNYQGNYIKEQREGIAKRNQKRIMFQNKQNRKFFFQLKQNQLLDQSDQEYKALLNGVVEYSAGEVYKKQTKRTLDDEDFSWVELGHVDKDAHDQQNCKACYAYAIADAVSAQLSIQDQRQTNKEKADLQSLSVQQIVDCSRNYMNFGCGGGSMKGTYNFIMANGLNKEKNYPNTNDDSGVCKDNSGPFKIKGYEIVQIENNNEEAILNALVNVGPLVVYLDASSFEFRFYKKGSFECSKETKLENLNHIALLVGYDEQNWIIKNSWGRSWGENGYLYLSRRKRNNCGIYLKANYPIV